MRLNKTFWLLLLTMEAMVLSGNIILKREAILPALSMEWWLIRDVIDQIISASVTLSEMTKILDVLVDVLLLLFPRFD